MIKHITEVIDIADRPVARNCYGEGGGGVGGRGSNGHHSVIGGIILGFFSYQLSGMLWTFTAMGVPAYPVHPPAYGPARMKLITRLSLQIYDRVTAKLSADLQLKLGGGLCKLLEQVKYKTRVDWHEASDGFLLSGTLDQLIEVRTVIQQSLGKDTHKKILGVLSDTEKIFEGFNYSKKSSEQKTHLNQDKKQNAKSEDTPEEKMLVSHEIHKPSNAKVSSIGKCNEATTMKSSVKKKSPPESRKTTGYKGVDRQQLNPMQTVSNNVSNPRNEAERLPCDSEKAQLSITASANCKSKMDGKKTIASSDTPDAKEEVVQRSCIIPAGMMRFLGHVHSEIFTNLEKCVDIQIQKNTDTCKLTLMQKVGSESEFETKCKEFSSFYRQLKQKTHQKEIKLDKQRQIDDEVLQTVINDVQSGSLVLIDTSKDLNSLTIYGTFDNVTFAEEMLAEALHIKDVDKNSITVGRDNRLEYVTKTGIKLSVLKGDITMEISDVIVNAANERLVHGGGVAKAIVDKGGRGIQDESSHIVRSCGEVQPGKVTWTRAGALPCKGIIHAVGPRWKPEKGSQCKKILRSAVRESLLMASGLRMKSIAFPPISAGIFGMPPTISAKVMFDAALKFANNLHPTYEGISDIRFVVIDDPTFEVFKGEFITRFTDGDPNPKQFTDRSKGQSIVTENAYIDKKPDARSCLRRENRSADSYQGISKDKPDHGGVEMRTSVNEKHSNGESRPRNQSNQEQVNHKTLETNLSKSQSGEQKTLSSGSEKAVRVEEPVASSRKSKQDSLPRGTSDTKAPYKRKTKNDESRGEDSEIEISKRNLGKEAKKASSVSDSSQFKFTIEEILLNPNVTSKNNNEKDTMEISTLTADISTSLIREPSPLTNPDNAAQSSDASNEFRNESNKIPWVTKERERQEARKGSTGFSPAEVDANKIVEPGSLMQSGEIKLSMIAFDTLELSRADLDEGPEEPVIFFISAF